MPPKRTDLHHVTFHFHRSAVFLSLPGSTPLGTIKKQLLAAIQPLSDTLPSPPKTEADIELYEEKPIIEGSQEQPGQLRSIEGDGKTKTLTILQWDRWKKVYVSLRDPDGNFSEPVYVVPSNDDGEVEEDEQ